MECWASTLGNCGGGSSREHYVSDGVFDGETVTLHGLAWCRDTAVTIGLKAAVAKILCRKHNAALSEYDAQAAKLSRFLNTNVLRDPVVEASVTLNGLYVEKWALKTFLNLGYIRNLHGDQPNRLQPPAHLVRYIFGKEPVSDGVGLYFVSSKITNEDYAAGLRWNAIQNRNKPHEVFGMVFTFHGVRFVVSIPPKRAEERIRGLGKVGDFDYSTARIVYRPPHITLKSATAGFKRITLEW